MKYAINRLIIVLEVGKSVLINKKQSSIVTVAFAGYAVRIVKNNKILIKNKTKRYSAYFLDSNSITCNTYLIDKNMYKKYLIKSKKLKNVCE